MPRSMHGGRHELGQNFLNHQPTIDHITALIADSSGHILEIGAGNGALTRSIAGLGRPITAIDLDEHRVRRLRRTLPSVNVEHADALRYPLAAPVIVGNIPFHLTTPILRRLLAASGWQHAVLLTQWEVARKRAGVGGHTMMTAQNAPWFDFALKGRVPAWQFTPMPSVDGGVLAITRRSPPLLPLGERRGYEHFVRAVFTGSGGSLARIIQRATRRDARSVQRGMSRACIPATSLPRALTPVQWATLWGTLRP